MNASEAAWQLHLENLQLRGENTQLRAELARANKRADKWERLYRIAKAVVDRERTYRKQVRKLVRS